jgi:hypothetical protein
LEAWETVWVRPLARQERCVAGAWWNGKDGTVIQTQILVILIFFFQMKTKKMNSGA